MDYRFFKKLRSFPALNSFFWRIRPFFARSPLWCGLWQSLAEGNRLLLPSVESALLHDLALHQITLPGTKDPGHGQDAPLPDLVFLLQLAKMLNPRKILEIGTYRAKTTYALAINCPDAEITSFDIAKISSPYRDTLEKDERIALKILNFSKSPDTVEGRIFDFIFIDAGHRLAEVLADSSIALNCLAPAGCVVWHDYRKNEFFNPGLEVPEALNLLAKSYPIFSIPGTTCAIYKEGFSGRGSILGEYRGK